MKVYKVDFENSDSKVVTAENRDSLSERYNRDTVQHIESYGPYISECVYRELREEILTNS